MRLLALFLVGAVLVTLAVQRTVGWGAGQQPVVATEAPPEPLAVGAAPPAFTLLDQDGRPVRVGGPAPGWTVVSFFRKADRPEVDSPW